LARLRGFAWSDSNLAEWGASQVGGKLPFDKLRANRQALPFALPFDKLRANGRALPFALSLSKGEFAPSLKWT
jgi:hypothetical protein